VVKYFYEGLPLGASIPWISWIKSTLPWLVLVGLVYLAFLGLATVLHRLWADDERLSYPLVKLPLEMISEHQSGAFLYNKLMWIGFALPVVYFGINGLHANWPQIPGIPVEYSLNGIFTGQPWTSVGMMVTYFSLAGVGLFYLLPSDILLSLWFFFLFARFQELVGGMLVGSLSPARHAASAEFIADQTAGIYVVLVGLMVYSAWYRIRRVWQLQAQGDAGVANTLMTFRTAATCIAIALAIIMARATSQAGAPMTEGSFTPLDVVAYFTSRSKLRTPNLVLFAFSDSLFSRDLRGMVLTGFLDGQKLADGVGLSRRKLLPVLLGAGR